MSTKERQRILYNFHMPGKTNAKGPASLCAEAGPLIWLPFKISDQKKEKGKKENKEHLSGRGPSICSRRPFGHLKAPLGFHCFANANFTYLDNGNVNFPDNKKYSRSKPTIIRIPPTTLMPIRLTLLFFIILFAKTNSSAPTTIIKTDINGYMSFLLSNSDS